MNKIRTLKPKCFNQKTAEEYLNTLERLRNNLKNKDFCLNIDDLHLLLLASILDEEGGKS